MSTYTPNYNLEKPEASDPFGDFRQSYNDNMDIIDANLGGGGGSGGHTIIDENGQSMTQRTGLEFTGNVQVTDDSVNDKTIVDILGGGGNVYGAFLDPSRIVYSSFTFDSSAHSWTATEDCILTDNMTPPDGSTAYFIRIDGKQVFAGYSTVEDPFVYVKKGQVVEYRGKSGSSMKAYAVQQGTNGIFAPVIYSDNERVIGVWRDNKPLYQRAFTGLSVVLGSDWVNAIDISSMNMEVCILGIGIVSNTYQTPLCTRINGNYLQAYMSGMGGVTITTIVIQYTKTTDTAGSGNWNTNGVPTHHYSTSEQVIGTWIDGKPLYEITLSLGALPNNAIKTVPHNIADVDLIFVSDSFFQTGAGASSYLNYTNDTTAGQIEIVVNKTDFEIWAGSDRSSWNGYATIRYTKTTDA